MKLLRIFALFLLLPGSIGCGPPGALPGGTPDPRREEALAVVARIGVVGASVSDGFRNQLPLAAVLDQALKVPHEIDSQTSFAFFLLPRTYGRNQIRHVEAGKPSLVLATDFLFWFAYGWKSLEERERDLQYAFHLLERFGTEIPVLIGDVPDMRGASPLVLPPMKIPSREEIAVLNDQIRRWASSRPNIHLLPLSRWAQELKEGKVMAEHGERVELESTVLLGGDRLHPTVTGQVSIVLGLLEVLRGLYPGLHPEDLILEPQALEARCRVWMERRTND